MENPLTWNETQKLIDKHIRLHRRVEERGSCVAGVLLDAGLIERESAELVKDIVIETIDTMEHPDYDICGYSQTTTIYLKLDKLKLLKEANGQSSHINQESR
jgi:hypothetical protein